MKSNTIQKLPKWFWVLAVFFLLWNIMGVFSFIAHTFITDEMKAQLPSNEQALYNEYPLWTTIVFAVAVGAGLLGAIGLFIKKKWAFTAFLISFLAVIPQMFHNVFMTSSINVYGVAQAITMPILVVLISAVLVWYTRFCISKQWLS